MWVVYIQFASHDHARPIGIYERSSLKKVERHLVRAQDDVRRAEKAEVADIAWIAATRQPFWRQQKKDADVQTVLLAQVCKDEPDVLGWHLQRVTDEW